MTKPSRSCHRAVLFGLTMSVLGVGALPSAADEMLLMSDLPYKTGDLSEYERQRCKLDLYLPRNDNAFATIVWFHGGSLQSGDKAGDIATALGRRFAGSGIAVASVNYRLHPNVSFPAYIEDAAAAVAFVHREIREYGGSPKRVFISGHSAGGYLAAMVGVDERYLTTHGLQLSDVAGLMPIAGQMITHSTVRAERSIPRAQPVIDAAAPAYHASARSAPFLNIVGGQDLPARAEENRYFVAAMKAAGHPDVTYFEVEGRNHGTVANRIGQPHDAVAGAITAFVDRLRQ